MTKKQRTNSRELAVFTFRKQRRETRAGEENDGSNGQRDERDAHADTQRRCCVGDASDQARRKGIPKRVDHKQVDRDSGGVDRRVPDFLPAKDTAGGCGASTNTWPWILFPCHVAVMVTSVFTATGLVVIGNVAQ